MSGSLFWTRTLRENARGTNRPWALRADNAIGTKVDWPLEFILLYFDPSSSSFLGRLGNHTHAFNVTLHTLVSILALEFSMSIGQILNCPPQGLLITGVSVGQSSLFPNGEETLGSHAMMQSSTVQNL